MTHVRTQIRRAAVARLTGLRKTGVRVYSGRSRPAAKDADPYLLVYATEERSDVSDDGAMGADPILGRFLNLVIEGRAVASSAEEIEDTLDQIALEVEPTLTQDSSLGGLAIEVTLTGTRILIESPGERHAGEIRMEFRVRYRTRESRPHLAA